MAVWPQIFYLFQRPFCYFTFSWRVTIPANLAYGANGPGSIGPNNTLIFEMELLGLTK